jgi:NTP pyrophosphatase (non-canonical NTP hydrolase)
MSLNKLAIACHSNAMEKGFYDSIIKILNNCDMEDYNFIKNSFISQQLMLIVSELGESIEGLRKNDLDNFREELADTFIRLFDLCGFLKININYEVSRKMKINKERPNLHNKIF